MDEVEIEYRHSIMQALQSASSEKLMELVPGMSVDRAKECINKWKENYNTIMSRIRSSIDTTEVENEQLQMLNDLLEEANLFGFHK